MTLLVAHFELCKLSSYLTSLKFSFGTRIKHQAFPVYQISLNTFPSVPFLLNIKHMNFQNG